MTHDAFSLELLRALSTEPQTAAEIRSTLAARGVAAPLRSIQTKLSRLSEYPRYPIDVDTSSQPYTYAWAETAAPLTVPEPDDAERILSVLSRTFAAQRNGLYRDRVPVDRRLAGFPLRWSKKEPEAALSKTVFARVVRAVREKRLLGASVAFPTTPKLRGGFYLPAGLYADETSFSLVALDEDRRPVIVDLARLRNVRVLLPYGTWPEGVESDFDRLLEIAEPL